MTTLRSAFVPASVTVSGRPLPEKRWSYDRRTAVLEVRASVPAGGRIQVSGRR